MTFKNTSKKREPTLKLLLLLFLIFFGFLGVQWVTFERQPLPKALAAIESDAAVTVTQQPWLTFTPAQISPTTGFIFYPGGRISFLGYSDFMRNIASQGYLVVVPQMPFNIAAFNPNIANKIIAHHPDITHWVIGGHSVGGTMAAQYTHSHHELISGLVIWASYPADNTDLSAFTIPIALIYGSLDPAVNDSSVKVRQHLLPKDTMYVRINGGDHHQFGSYEIKSNEHHAIIDPPSQMLQILESTLHILKIATNID